MKLYDLADAMTIQGNVEVRVFKDDDHVKSYRYNDCDDFRHSGYDCEEDGIDDMEVLYMFAEDRIYRSQGVWLIIEVTAEVDA
jgi:hypothetical protein